VSAAAPLIDVIIPALNEAENLPWLLSRMPAGYRPIVVDNNSTDATAEVAAAHGAVVVSERVPGFGSASFAGLLAATAPFVCFLDGDGSLDPRDLPLVADPVIGGRFDLLLGARRPSKGAMQLHQRVANRALALELRRRTKVPFTDLGPMRACGREPLIALGMKDRRSGWPLEMVLRAHAAGWRIGETPVPYSPRLAGQSKVTGTVMGTLRAVKDMGQLLR
jgi:glycosyltransferase involved in cell wall biosynthesis